MIVPDKETETLLNAEDKQWVFMHGPMEQLIMDEETGLAAPKKSKAELNKVKEFFDQRRIKYVPRAKEQYIGHIDRRGALLKDTNSQNCRTVQTRTLYNAI